MTCECQMHGKVFHSLGAKTEKALSLYVFVAVLGRLSSSSDTDRNDLEDLRNCSRSDKYPGLIPLIDL